MVENQPQKRQSRYTDKELELINNTFLDNAVFVKALRKQLIQQPMSDVEKNMVESTVKGDVAKVVRKIFIPELDGDVSLTNLTDVHYVATEDRSPEAIYFDIQVNRKKFEFLEQQLKAIEGGDEKIQLDDFVNIEGIELFEVCVNYAVRTKVLGHVESNLNLAIVLAGQKKETAEEILKRLNADSAK